MMWWNHGAWSAGDWLAMSLMTLVFAAVLVAMAVWLRSLGNEPTQTGREQPPMTDRADGLLAEQFARGEIDEEEFNRRRKVLHATSGRSDEGGA